MEEIETTWKGAAHLADLWEVRAYSLFPDFFAVVHKCDAAAVAGIVFL